VRDHDIWKSEPPLLNLAPKKKQPTQIEKKMMEKFEKMGKQGVGIEEILKQLLDESVSNSLSMAQMEELMRELKMVVDGSLKRIEMVEKKVETPPPPHRRHR
jgi:ribosome biogenesis protein Tsr3